jgi:hypothetical protein
METMMAAAVFGPIAGAVTAYNAWGIYVAWRNRQGARRARRPGTLAPASRRQ